MKAWITRPSRVNDRAVRHTAGSTPDLGSPRHTASDTEVSRTRTHPRPRCAPGHGAPSPYPSFHMLARVPTTRLGDHPTYRPPWCTPPSPRDWPPSSPSHWSPFLALRPLTGISGSSSGGSATSGRCPWASLLACIAVAPDLRFHGVHRSGEVRSSSGEPPEGDL